MTARATIKDVAKAAGVSFTTVSLAFQEDSRISAKRRRQILAIARELGYSPNQQARALRSGRTRTIGVLVNDIVNPFYALVTRAAQNAANRRGYEVVITDTQFVRERETQEIRNMIHARVEGVLACFGESVEESSKLLEHGRVPYLALDTVPQTYRGPYVANDVPAAARIAVEHLIRIGCRHPVFLSGDEGSRSFSAFVALEKAFLETLRVHGVDANQRHLFSAGLTIDAGRNAMRRVHAEFPEVDALLSANSLCAMGAMEVASQLGLCIGSDLAVIGIDDLDICSLERISLTTIRQPFEQLAEVATNILLDCLERKTDPDVRLVLQPELIVRSSTTRRR
jgi:LacI family transcriptional regulator